MKICRYFQTDTLYVKISKFNLFRLLPNECPEAGQVSGICDPGGAMSQRSEEKANYLVINCRLSTLNICAFLSFIILNI